MRVEVIGDAKLYLGDCRDVLATLEPSSVDSIVTDPPYGLKFMGKAWDHGVPGVEFWTAALRVAKPGAHLLAFGGTRTYHRLICAIEDAGWEIRDCLGWLYGSGFPKSMDVSKAIDKAAGAEREVVSTITDRRGDGTGYGLGHSGKITSQTPVTAAAVAWEGWGTALKPAWEPIVLARKPLAGTVAANVLKYGTGAINVDACRVGDEEITTKNGRGSMDTSTPIVPKAKDFIGNTRIGRWPANILHDGSDEVVGIFPETAPANASMRGDRSGVNTDFGGSDGFRGHTDNGGSAARFFYAAKASREDRDEGLEAMRIASAGEITGGRAEGSAGLNNPRAGAGRNGGGRNIHPTVKPTDLMRYLVRLVTPPGGTCLDMFMGSGSTGKACKYEGFGFIGIDLEDAHVDIAKARIQYADKKAREQPELFKVERQPEREEPTLF